MRRTQTIRPMHADSPVRAASRGGAAVAMDAENQEQAMSLYRVAQRSLQANDVTECIE